MILSEVTIRKYLKEGKIIISPEVPDSDIRPVGIRVHLAEEILIPKPNQNVDLSNPTELEYDKVNIKEEGYIMRPGSFVLAATNEKIKTEKDILTILDGRSTIARLGLTTHITAGVLDGTMYYPQAPVLEIKNVGVFNITVRHKDPIALVCFHKLSQKVRQEILPKYDSQDAVAAPALIRDWEEAK